MNMTREPSHRHPDQMRWNERFQSKGFETFGRKPAQWLVQHEELLVQQPKGPALDLAAGNGRNAFHLARLGFAVDALDISDVAIAWLEEQASQRQLDVRPRWANLETELLPEEYYQVVVNVNYLERRTFPRIKASLIPGGLLFFETITRDQIDVLGHQIDPRYTLEHHELLRAFSDLRVLEYRETIIQTDTARKKAIASLVARKVDA